MALTFHLARYHHKALFHTGVASLATILLLRRDKGTIVIKGTIKIQRQFEHPY